MKKEKKFDVNEFHMNCFKKDMESLPKEVKNDKFYEEEFLKKWSIVK